MQTVKISKNFKQQATRAILSIILFIIVYFLLLVIAFGILAGAAYLAFWLITYKISFYTIMIGIGLLAVGVFVVIFMVKFLFSKDKSDYSHLTFLEIEKQPVLKEMIADLVSKTGTKFPKKIYISHEVNASVFYDSGFWSMFLPVSKNLHIGLGLVNTTTASELKGILAHEFGHFSQRSMKVGSYVYNVNKIIHNILYDNDDYERLINRWSESSGYFVLLINLALVYNKAVQYILRQVYKLLNVSYMGLSRQMEFHADAIAANIVGSQPMINSLLRLNLASESYGAVIQFYNSKIKDSVKPENIFPQHAFALNFIATSNKIEIIENLPHVTADYMGRFNKSKLVIDNQWSSHPSDEDRISAFLRLDVPAIDLNSESANTLFSDYTTLQKEVTEKMFAEVVYEETPVEGTLQSFKEEMIVEYDKNSYPQVFNNYYDDYNIIEFDIDKNLVEPEKDSNATSLFTNEIVELIGIMIAEEKDAQLLKDIAANPYDLKTFDYDGKKFKVNEASSVQQIVEKQHKLNREIIAKNDLEIFRYFNLMSKLNNRNHEYLSLYKNVFKANSEFEKLMHIYMDMSNNFAFAYETMPIESIYSNLKNYKNTDAAFKESLTAILSDEFYANAITEETKSAINSFLNSEQLYFTNDRYNEEQIELRNIALSAFHALANKMYIDHKAKLLQFKASLIA